jgi:hypothetical protein
MRIKFGCGLDSRIYGNLGTAVTNQNFIQEEIKGRLYLGNACHHSYSPLLSKHVKMGIYETGILPVVLYGCET